MNDRLERWLPIIEAMIFASPQPVSLERLELILQSEEQTLTRATIKACLAQLESASTGRSIALIEVASGYQYRVKPEFSPWLEKISAERAPRYSRALLETLALIIYRQPVTRAEIEAVRGVAVSSQILRTLFEREWIKVVGHKEVPGKPALLATTRAFLDDFNLKSLKELPPLAAFINLDNTGQQVEMLLNEVEVSELQQTSMVFDPPCAVIAAERVSNEES